MTIDMSQFYQVFFEESAELLEEMERLLLELDVAEPGKDALNAIFRTAHSIKGGSATFGFNEITETTHVLESLLDKLRNGELAVRVEMVDVFLKAVDVIKMQLAGRQFESEVDAQAVAEIRRRLNELAHDGPAGTAVAAGAAQATQPAAAMASSATDGAEPVDPSPENLFAILMETQPAEAQTTAAAPAQGADTAAAVSSGASGPDGYGFFSETPLPAPAGAESRGRRASDISGDAQPKRGRRASDHIDIEATSIRVGVEKVDQLINLVGELVITQAMLAQTASHVDPSLYEALRTGLAQLEHNTRDL
ncbi:MAG TPA: Hpt domain-containing protein, partial [Burkholderiales bacterium]|nr:Hpt domain-containing protein [Burkholderiales bacterium]